MTATGEQTGSSVATAERTVSAIFKENDRIVALDFVGRVHLKSYCVSEDPPNSPFKGRARGSSTS